MVSTGKGFVDHYPVFLPVGFNSSGCNLDKAQPECSEPEWEL